MAGSGDARLLDASGEFGVASGEYGEDGAVGGCDLPHSYLLSASFCSESARKGDKQEHL